MLGRLLEQGLCLRRTRREFRFVPGGAGKKTPSPASIDKACRGSYGLLERNRPYWHWLLERRAYDQFYVALDGPDLWDFNESSTQLVGYAAIKGERSSSS